MIQFLRSQKSARIIQAVQATLVLAVAFGAPLTAPLMAAIVTFTTLWMAALVGDPKPGVDGDPETPA